MKSNDFRVRLLSASFSISILGKVIKCDLRWMNSESSGHQNGRLTPLAMGLNIGHPKKSRFSSFSLIHADTHTQRHNYLIYLSIHPSMQAYIHTYIHTYIVDVLYIPYIYIHH